MWKNEIIYLLFKLKVSLIEESPNIACCFFHMHAMSAWNLSPCLFLFLSFVYSLLSCTRMQILTPFPRCDLISHVNSRKCPFSVGLLIQAIDCYSKKKEQGLRRQCPWAFLNKFLFVSPPAGNVKFIDYEYAGYNYQAYDIGNHFNEFAGMTRKWSYSNLLNQDWKISNVNGCGCGIFVIDRSEWGGLHPLSWARAPVAVAPVLSGGLQRVQITGHTGLQHWSGVAVRASQPIRLGEFKLDVSTTVWNRDSFWSICTLLN